MSNTIACVSGDEGWKEPITKHRLQQKAEAVGAVFCCDVLPNPTRERVFVYCDSTHVWRATGSTVILISSKSIEAKELEQLYERVAAAITKGLTDRKAWQAEEQRRHEHESDIVELTA